MMLKIQNQANNDFTVIALQNNIRMEKIYLESVIDIMSIEADFIESCMEMGQIVTEALDSTDVEVTKKRNIFDRIMDAIEALFGTFKEKVKVLMDKNNQWLKANLVNITKENVSKLGDVELVPYWTRSADAISNSLQDITNTLVNRTKASPEKYSSMDELTKIVRQKIGGSGDLASDAKHFFRTGKPNVETKPVTINGPSLSVYIDEMYNYVIQYDKVVVPRLNKFMNTIKSTVNGLKSTGKVESFCFLENAMYSDTEIGLLPNFSIVLEETKDPKDTQMQNGKIDDNKGKSMTSVNVTGKTDDEKKQETENSAKLTEYCKNLTNILKILQGAALTVLEEKYITYVNLFKAVINNDKSNKPKEGEKSTKETDTETDDVVVEDGKKKKKKKKKNKLR